jgi:hypothetical protein
MPAGLMCMNVNAYNNIYLGAQREQLSLAVDGAICSGVKGEMSKIYFPRVRSSGGLRAFEAASLPLYLSLSRRFLPLIWSKFISKQARPLFTRRSPEHNGRNNAGMLFFSGCVSIKKS